MSARCSHPCPRCGAPTSLERVEKGIDIFRVNPGAMPALEAARRPALVVSCSGCEWLQEVVIDISRMLGSKPISAKVRARLIAKAAATACHVEQLARGEASC